jgi:hypothetical protein
LPRDRTSGDPADIPADIPSAMVDEIPFAIPDPVVRMASLTALDVARNADFAVPMIDEDPVAGYL